MGLLVSEFGMFSVKSGLWDRLGFSSLFSRWGFSLWGWMCLDYLCMSDYGWLRVIPVCNLKFFDLTNSFHCLGPEYLMDFQKWPWCEYYSNILPLYLCLGWLALESILQILDHRAPHYNHLSLISIVACLSRCLLSKSFTSLLWDPFLAACLSEVNLSDLGVCISVL